VYKSPIYEQSRRVIGKRKKDALENYLRIPTVLVLCRYYVLLLRYFAGTEVSFSGKIGQFFVYNFARKNENRNFQKRCTGEKEDLQHSF